MFNGADMGAICRPAMPTDLPVKYEDKVSLENIGFLKRDVYKRQTPDRAMCF